MTIHDRNHKHNYPTYHNKSSNMLASDRNQLLARLCPGDRSESWQKDLERSRVPGSCHWILDDPKTKEWLHGSIRHLLWLHGPSATGKTFLCSRLVEHILESPVTKGNTVASVHFQQNHRQYNLADFNHALTSVLRQLVSQLSSESGILKRLAEMDKIPYPGDDEFCEILYQVASEFGKVFIVFDGADSVTTSALRDLMLAIAPNGSDPIFRVLFASRNAPPDGPAASFRVLDISSRAHDRDVEMYTTQTLRDVSAKDVSSGYEGLVQDLVRIFDGIFLPIPVWPVETPMPEFLTSLNQLLSISRGTSTSNRIDSFCKETVTQIMACQWSDMILCILYHIIKAAEAGYTFTMPMTLQALDAWQIQKDNKAFNAEEIILRCHGLISHGSDESMRIVSPLLGNNLKREVFGVEYEKRSISASMRYLSSVTFAQGACTSSTALRERLHNNRYLWYAARMLGPSLATTTPETFVQDFVQLSSRRGSIESYLQAAESWPYESQAAYDEYEQDEERWRCFTPGYTALHLAAHLAAPAILIDTLIIRGEALEAQDSDGRTALHLAAEIEGDNPTLQALLSAGSNVLAEDNLGNTPLSVAVVSGGLESVRLLLDHGAELGELDEDTLEQCGQEKPEIASHLRGLGLDVPVDVESDAED
ncbi:hypothetical protein KAF25_000654 [Fusarium avenaceum]|uniref:Nephrocystin 3-like N-terminal domain-containing protein n=1 Tax=Fusarium avenaceum TaxID=40199 RepID=A0A9P7GXY5_9HYPO|nr:hypothetical protein KAF25_000654 [Fusarium avenaceum]